MDSVACMLTCIRVMIRLCAYCALNFTLRLYVMQRTVLLSQFCLSACPSSDACIVTKLNEGLRIFLYHTKRQSLYFSDTNNGWQAI